MAAGRRRGRRGRVYEELARIIHSPRVETTAYSVVVEERGAATGLREIPLDQVEALKRGYLVLRDGTVIPLHRVVEIRGPSGPTNPRRAERSHGDRESQE